MIDPSRRDVDERRRVVVTETGRVGFLAGLSDFVFVEFDDGDSLWVRRRELGWRETANSGPLAGETPTDAVS